MFHRIYIEKRCLVICRRDSGENLESGSHFFHPSENMGIPTLVEMFKTDPSMQEICLPAEDTEEAYRNVCSEFREVNAGGGLVRNGRSEYLLIKRNGLWDLPKGHQEEGEDIRDTSLREVREETGVSELNLGDLICITDHCYIRDGIWYLKHTWWYDMFSEKPVATDPQFEEGITEALWAGKSSLPSLLKDTFPSIVEVFRKIGLSGEIC